MVPKSGKLSAAEIEIGVNSENFSFPLKSGETVETGEDWVSSRGDWVENQSGGLCGKMKEISQKVRRCGMKFGLWFEIESAAKTSQIVRIHPEYFIEHNDYYFLNFENSAARKYILETLERNIKEYNIEFIKFDFNQDMDFDFSKAAVINYLRGYEKVIYRLKKTHPEIHLENCASGGLRADLHNSFIFDSFWLSDNQSPLEGMRIFKEGIKRLPPQCIEKWAVVTSVQDIFPVYGKNEKCEKIISAHDATCDAAIGISKSFLKGFLSGGPIGISCDLTKLSDDLIKLLAEHIKEFKSEHEFWASASCRILCDTEKVLVLCYSARDKIKLIAYSYKTNQNSIYVYPKLDSASEYLFEGKVISGKDIAENGIEIKLCGNYKASFAELIRCKKYSKPEHCSR